MRALEPAAGSRGISAVGYRRVRQNRRLAAADCRRTRAAWRVSAHMLAIQAQLEMSISWNVGDGAAVGTRQCGVTRHIRGLDAVGKGVPANHVTVRGHKTQETRRTSHLHFDWHC